MASRTLIHTQKYYDVMDGHSKGICISDLRKELFEAEDLLSKIDGDESLLDIIKSLKAEAQDIREGLKLLGEDDEEAIKKIET